MPASEKIALSVPETATLLGVGKNLVYEMVKREDCDFAFRFGGRWLVSRVKLEEWVNRQAGGRVS